MFLGYFRGCFEGIFGVFFWGGEVIFEYFFVLFGIFFVSFGVFFGIFLIHKSIFGIFWYFWYLIVPFGTTGYYRLLQAIAGNHRLLQAITG